MTELSELNNLRIKYSFLQITSLSKAHNQNQQLHHSVLTLLYAKQQVCPSCSTYARKLLLFYYRI